MLVRQLVLAGVRGGRYDVPTGSERLEAIVKPFKLEEVRQALLEAGVLGLTVYEAEGIGRQKGRSEIYRGSEYAADMLPKIKLEILVDDDRLEQVVAVLARARTRNAWPPAQWPAPPSTRPWKWEPKHLLRGNGSARTRQFRQTRRPCRRTELRRGIRRPVRPGQPRRSRLRTGDAIIGDTQ